MADAVLPIDINQQPPLKTANDDPTAESHVNSPDEQSELLALNRLIKKAKDYRKKYDSEWDKYEAYYRGDQWYGKKRPSYRAAPCANVIRPAIQTTVPIMTDTTPGIDVVPTDPTDYAFADILSKANRYVWLRTGAQMKVVEAVEDSLVYGCGFLKCVWDAEAEDKRGEIAITAIDPHNIFVLEGTTDVNDSCPCVVEFYPSSVAELKAKFPDKAKFIHATGKRGDPAGDRSDSYSKSVRVVSPVDKDENMDQPNVTGTADDTDTVWVVEAWIDDYAVEDYPSDDGATLQKRKYPRGKVVQAVPDLQLILNIAENPYMDGKKPYVRFVSTVRPRQFWGVGEIEPVIETQDLINRALAVIYDYAATITNPVWILDMDSGVDPNMITNQIGLIINKQRGSEVRRDAAPPLPPQLFELYQMARELFDTQTGVHDVTQGRKPTGITAAEAINSMQEAAQTRIRLKERNMQQALTQLGRLLVSRMLQYYKSPRVVKITGAKTWPEYFAFYVEDTPEGKYKLNKQQYEYNENESKYIPGDWQSGEETKGVFDVEVLAGSALPWMKAQRGDLALKLAGMNMLDQQAVLDTIEWPKKEEIIRRMQEAQAQAQAQTQAPPNQP